MIRSAKFILGGFLLYRGKTGGLIINNSYCYPLTNDLTPLTSVINIGESGWRSGHQSRLPPLRPGIEAARGLGSDSEGFSPGTPVFLQDLSRRAIKL